MASITKRLGKKGTKYLAQIRMKGHKPASATFTRKVDAEEWVKIAQADIIRGRYFRHSKAFSHTMSELFDKYETWPKFTEKKDQYSQGKQLNYWRDRIGDKLIGDVDSSLIDDTCAVEGDNRGTLTVATAGAADITYGGDNGNDLSWTVIETDAA